MSSNFDYSIRLNCPGAVHAKDRNCRAAPRRHIDRPILRDSNTVWISLSWKPSNHSSRCCIDHCEGVSKIFRDVQQLSICRNTDARRISLSRFAFFFFRQNDRLRQRSATILPFVFINDVFITTRCVKLAAIRTERQSKKCGGLLKGLRNSSGSTVEDLDPLFSPAI